MPGNDEWLGSPDEEEADVPPPPPKFEDDEEDMIPETAPAQTYSLPEMREETRVEVYLRHLKNELHSLIKMTAVDEKKILFEAKRNAREWGKYRDYLNAGDAFELRDKEISLAQEAQMKVVTQIVNNLLSEAERIAERRN